MAHADYRDSTYQFTDPVRFFKANDPYYFEVDNIPLKQLQENCLWLKDQLKSGTTMDAGGVKRQEIDELRPYATGFDRTIRVLPGRFTARINDVGSKDPLAYLYQILGTNLGETNVWAADLPKAINKSLLAAVNKFKSSLPIDALGMNGLAERAFTWPMVEETIPVNYSGVKMWPASNSSYLHYDKNNNNPGLFTFVSPTLITEALVWGRTDSTDSDQITIMNFNPNAAIGAAQTPAAESMFIKKWRGVSRLAIVDVDTELTVDVPQFDSNDFSYTDSAGNQTPVTGVLSRIDLVFIYSKPIDASGVKLMGSTQVTTINKPQLGIVQGAGIHMTEKEFTGVDAQQQQAKQATTDTHKILASPGDQYNTEMGFTSTSGNDITYDVRGSFPAPDDILNIAPLLSEQLESNAYELLGQSILPVAYIWVQGTGDTNSDGTILVASTDVIDIRPLFRTAELAYNERAGISAALPQISLANPIVGRVNLDNESRKIINYVDSAVADSFTDDGDVSNDNAVLAAGYIFGGFFFGPEGALWDFEGGTQQNKVDVCTKYFGANAKTGSGNQLAVPDYPDWDKAQWLILGNYGGNSSNYATDPPKGTAPNDYIDTFISKDSYSEAGKATGGVAPDPTIVGSSFNVGVNGAGNPYNTTDTTPRLGAFNCADNYSTGNKKMRNRVTFHFIKKKISFSGGRPAWLYDYDIDIKFINCLPQNSTGTPSLDAMDYGPGEPGTYMGHWVEKHPEDFTIYIAFSARNTSVQHHAQFGEWLPSKGQHGDANKNICDICLPNDQRQGAIFSGFVVPVQELLESDQSSLGVEYNGFKGNPRIGMCTYPTIQWKLTGISNSNTPYFYVNLGVNNTIQLRQ